MSAPLRWRGTPTRKGWHWVDRFHDGKLRPEWVEVTGEVYEDGGRVWLGDGKRLYGAQVFGPIDPPAPPRVF